jgi:hypothetical protein
MRIFIQERNRSLYVRTIYRSICVDGRSDRCSWNPV